MKYFTKTNEWVSIQGNKARIGLTKAAQEHLGDVTFADLPSLGKSLAEGDVLASIESVKAVIELYAPLAGTVTGVNGSLAENPEALGTAPEDDAWVAELEIASNTPTVNLLTKEAYEAFLAGN